MMDPATEQQGRGTYQVGRIRWPGGNSPSGGRAFPRESHRGVSRIIAAARRIVDFTPWRCLCRSIARGWVQLENTTAPRVDNEGRGPSWTKACATGAGLPLCRSPPVIAGRFSTRRAAKRLHQRLFWLGWRLNLSRSKRATYPREQCATFGRGKTRAFAVDELWRRASIMQGPVPTEFHPPA